MKKIYIAPNINVTEIKVSHIICASSGTLSTIPEDVIENSDDFGSRGFDLWDDDEEEY